MLVKKPNDILSEIRDAISSRESLIRATVRGKQQFLTFPPGQHRNHSSVYWILHAQLGTLDKIKNVFVREGEYGTFELLAIARNLFENLVWLRLFNNDPQYGLVFYEQLLDQQKKNTENFMAKAESELILFDEYEKIDAENLDISFLEVLGEEPSAEQIEAAQAQHRKRTEELDTRARRSFAMYAAAAKFNGYGYQCHLIRGKELPRQRAQLAEIQENLRQLSNVKPKLLNQQMLGRSSSRWNWRDRAKEVGMLEQYQFLYSYTSKLLHSTPMNLITEKGLSSSETLLMLEYAFVTVLDIFDAIQLFNFPGQANVMVIDI